MVVVGAGSGSRFTGDKMLAQVDGTPLVALTITRLLPHVDELVLVCRRGQRGELSGLGVAMVDGGDTRTASEIAGLEALEGDHALIGIHDGARPNVLPDLVERLFVAAETHGGAVPVVPAGPLLRTGMMEVVDGVYAAQTPQVFRGPELLAAFRRARGDGYVGRDTAEVVARYTSLDVAAVEGDPRNVKVTYPADLAKVIV